MERRSKAATQSGALLLIAGGILAASNTISAVAYKRADITRQQKYSLSKGSGSLVRSMKTDMKAEVYVTRGLPKLDAFVRVIRDLMQEYKNASNGKFDYTIIEAKTEDEKKAAKDAGLRPQPFGNLDGDEEKIEATQGYMGIVLKYGTEQTPVPLDWKQESGIEFWLTNKIRELRDKGDDIKHKVGVLTGHDEIKLSEANLVAKNPQAGPGGPSIQQIVTQNFPFYQLTDVDLKNGDAEIDDTLDGLIITQPGKDLTEKELRRIDQFVLKGKSLAVFASAVNVKAADASMNATLSTHGLEKLLSGYGIEMRKDAVVDLGRSFQVRAETADGMPMVYRFPQILSLQEDPRFGEKDALLDPSFVGFFRMEQGLAFPFSSSLLLHPEKQPDAKDFRFIARSTPRSFRETTDTVDLKPMRRWSVPKGAETGQFGVAATIESNALKTAFPSGDKMGVETPAASTKPARVLVIASAQFLANPFARAGNGPDMGQMGMQMPGGGGDEQLLAISGPYAQSALTQAILSFKNTLDWLTGDADLVASSAKILQDPPLVFGDVTKLASIDETDDQLKKREEDARHARKGTQNMVGASLIILLPLLFALLGFARWRLRMSARANVSLA